MFSDEEVIVMDDSVGFSKNPDINKRVDLFERTRIVIRRARMSCHKTRDDIS